MHPTLRSVFLTSVVLLACVLSAGCTQLAKSLIEISRLQADIAREYGEKNVNVNLNNSTVLSVTFVNSPLNEKVPAERAKRAAQTAAFVKQHYASINEIAEIWVSFVRSETHYIVVHYSVRFDAFGFDKEGRPLEAPPESPANEDSESRPRAVYWPGLKQTEVTISRLQLEGDLNYGLAVAPHFTVAGDATGVRRSSSYPGSVSFDFSSYSEKSIFPGEPKITAVSDGEVVFETSAQFLTSKLPDGKFYESLSLQIPYRAFRRMISGKKLMLRMGDREYHFTDDQMQALREMTQYVRE